MKNKTICIILARGGSKGLKKKNLRKINGKPLIYYPITDAIQSGVIDHVVVSTDNKKIAKVAKSYGAEIPFMRPKKLAGDLSTTEDGLKYTLLRYEKLTGQKFEFCVFLGATDIFRNINWIKKGLDILKREKKVESVFSGHVTHKNFWEKKKNKWIRLKPWMKKYSSRQVRQKIIREDTALTCVSRSYLWRKGNRIGDNIKIIENDDILTSLEIHDKKDLKIVDTLYKMRLKKII